MNRKAQTVNTAIMTLVFLAVGLVVVGFIVAFGASFTDTQSGLACVGAGQANFNGSCWTCAANFSYNGSNPTLNQCANSTGTLQNRTPYSSVAINASLQTNSALTSVAAGEGTVTTVAILAIVVGLLLGVVALFSYLRGNQGEQI